MPKITIHWTDDDQNTFEVTRLEWRTFGVGGYLENGTFLFWPYANLFEVVVHSPEEEEED